MNDFKPSKLVDTSSQNNNRPLEEDLRSLKSEYDYGSKRKFVDVLGNVSIGTKLKRLRAQHEIDKAPSTRSGI